MPSVKQPWRQNTGWFNLKEPAVNNSLSSISTTRQRERERENKLYFEKFHRLMTHVWRMLTFSVSVRPLWRLVRLWTSRAIWPAAWFFRFMKLSLLRLFCILSPKIPIIGTSGIGLPFMRSLMFDFWGGLWAGDGNKSSSDLDGEQESPALPTCSVTMSMPICRISTTKDALLTKKKKKIAPQWINTSPLQTQLSAC